MTRFTMSMVGALALICGGLVSLGGCNSGSDQTAPPTQTPEVKQQQTNSAEFFQNKAQKKK